VTGAGRAVSCIGRSSEGNRPAIRRRSSRGSPAGTFGVLDYLVELAALVRSADGVLLANRPPRGVGERADNPGWVAARCFVLPD
jgi:hypothetical protein